jgi:hypothetical protein
MRTRSVELYKLYMNLHIPSFHEACGELGPRLL